MRRGGPSRLSLKGRALQLLAQREHSRLELRRKLLPYAALLADAASPDAARLEAAPQGDEAPPDDGSFGRDARRLAPGAGAAAGDANDASPPRHADHAPSPRDAGDTPSLQDADDAPFLGDAGGVRAAAAPLHARGGERRAPVTPEVVARVDALLDALEAQGWLSDARFIESRVRARSGRLGTLRIRQELSRHGAELPAETAQALRASEASRAEAVWRRKFGEPAADAAGRARQMRFLAGRGFDAEVVRRVVPPPRRRDEPGDGDD